MKPRGLGCALPPRRPFDDGDDSWFPFFRARRLTMGGLGLLCLLEPKRPLSSRRLVVRTAQLASLFQRIAIEMDGGDATGGVGGEELTAQETALYDRQIRVWGADAQRRLSKSHVLVCGMTGTAVEFCKNIVLAGVGSLTLLDDRLITENAIQANFLIPPDETKWKEGSIAKLCCDSLKEFNPMVHVAVEKGDLSSFEDEFFAKFDAVVVSCCSLATKKEINNKCRKRPKQIAFYTVDCRGTCGEIFADLQNYVYVQKKPDGATECHMKYPSFEEVIKRLSGKGDPIKNFFFFDAMEGKGIIEDITAATPTN